MRHPPGSLDQNSACVRIFLFWGGFWHILLAAVCCCLITTALITGGTSPSSAVVDFTRRASPRAQNPLGPEFVPVCRPNRKAMRGTNPRYLSWLTARPNPDPRGLDLLRAPRTPSPIERLNLGRAMTLRASTVQMPRASEGARPRRRLTGSAVTVQSNAAAGRTRSGPQDQEKPFFVCFWLVARMGTSISPRTPPPPPQKTPADCKMRPQHATP